MADEALGEWAANHYFTVASKNLGETGTDALRQLQPHLKSVHNAIDYESISESLTVFYKFDSSIAVPETSQAHPVEDLNLLAVHNYGVLTVQVLDNGTYLVWKREFEISDLSAGSILYRYSKVTGERFWVDGVIADAPKPMSFTRIYGLSRFRDLTNCLKHYELNMARSCRCRILTSAWREEGRVVWNAGPEDEMRFSLAQHLRSSLREGNPDIREEMPVDGRNPVDIEVTWGNSNRIAVIEIKWLGASGKLNPAKITTRYYDQRARDGLEQLVDYLDRTRDRNATRDRRGFLFVFDGRRGNVKPESTVVSREDGLKYQDSHIEYPQEYLDRNDVADPIRCFCEPNFHPSGTPSRH